MPDITTPPSTRTGFDPAAMRGGEFYKLMTASVVPRPIAWVSTRSADGVLNLAPYSFFTVASSKPPILQFNSMGHKDSWRNTADTGEFVVNIGSESLIDQMNATSASFDHSVDEFEEVGLTAEPSTVVSVPRVAQAPISFECVRHSIIEMGNSSLIFGRVVHVSVRDDVLAPDGLPDFRRLAAPSRLGRSDWGLTPETVARQRPANP
ncbi:flavin reductase family protein [Tomitella biformata]|uniref:flavin reductase family protein n=1 Tax=Tomitella biformata TaxID=630403 RepID=UPI000463A93B|nr:flavin reductase family protein [Tomitella biformata]